MQIIWTFALWVNEIPHKKGQSELDNTKEYEQIGKSIHINKTELKQTNHKSIQWHFGMYVLYEASQS